MHGELPKVEQLRRDALAAARAYAIAAGASSGTDFVLFLEGKSQLYYRMLTDDDLIGSM